MQTDLLTTSEAAELLGVSGRTLSRWVEAGRITPAVTAPGRTGVRMFDRRDVQLLQVRLDADRRSA